MRSHSYLNSAKRILHLYKGTVPLTAWLKQFFKEHKKYGSKDRKEIAHLCYSYFRLGNSFLYATEEERILLGLFLSSSEPNLVLGELKPEWNEKVHLSVEGKIQLLNAGKELSHIFPFETELSSEIDPALFHKSFLLQPLLYLRIRPGEEHVIKTKLQKSGIDFELIEPAGVALSNSTKVDELIELNKEAVVQDLNSQRVLELLPAEEKQKKITAWDCCAASGGKSILLYDQYPNVHFTVTDVRKTILINLQKRFHAAGIRGYRHFVADVSSKEFSFKETFDLVICDAPCSGSGTWGRTPEQLFFFKEERIDHYANLQKSIALNASRSVNKKGYFLYITCSVFKKENEEVVSFIQKNTPLQLKDYRYFKGYDKRADTLFAALFTL
jgi:16S rRNA (cytosine967-C5)-methyltransferase